MNPQEPIPCFECSSTYERKEIDGIATLVCPECGDSVLGAEGIEQIEKQNHEHRSRLATHRNGSAKRHSH